MTGKIGTAFLVFGVSFALSQPTHAESFNLTIEDLLIPQGGVWEFTFNPVGEWRGLQSSISFGWESSGEVEFRNGISGGVDLNPGEEFTKSVQLTSQQSSLNFDTTELFGNFWPGGGAQTFSYSASSSPSSGTASGTVINKAETADLAFSDQTQLLMTVTNQDVGFHNWFYNPFVTMGGDLDPFNAIAGTQDVLNMTMNSPFGLGESVFELWNRDGAADIVVDIQISLTDVTSVPEPSTLFLLGTGLFGLIGYGRRKRRA